MGRGVSYPPHSIVRVYKDISWMGYDFDEDGKMLDEYDDLQALIHFKDEIDYYKSMLIERYKSLYDCDKWLAREDHAFLQNSHCYIGVSTYISVACYWLVSRSDYDSDWIENPQLADSWCQRIADGFEEIIKPDMYLLGRFSNGESVYQIASK